MPRNLVPGVSADYLLEKMFVTDLCEVINTPRSLAVEIMLRYDALDEYLKLNTDPYHYDNPSNFADDHLVTEVLRKSPNLPIEANRVDQALDSFLVSELSCFYANQRVKDCPWPMRFDFIRSVQSVLGPLDFNALSEIDKHFRHGPGATATLRGRGLVPSDKFEKRISSTLDLYPYYKSILGSNWHSANKLQVEICGGNKFSTVPKTSLTDRGMAAEPTLNMYVQLGIGKYIRKRLKRFGVDLDTQDDNRRLASIAHEADLVTVDLSSASDSLCYQTILQFFPEPWVDLLCLPRSHRCNVFGDTLELEKFSSMGNGYTFELESVVFYSLLRSIVAKEDLYLCGVFGDDLIYPRRYHAKMVDALKFLGFRVNTRKTFLAGRFFESCGTDWFDGINVRPFYLKGSKQSIPYVVQITNKLRIYSYLRGGNVCSDSRFRRLWVKYFTMCPKFWRRCKVPLHLGDTGLIVGSKELPFIPARDQIEGQVCQHVVMTPVVKRKHSYFLLLASLPRGEPLSDYDLLYDESNPFLSDIRENVFTKGREPRRGYLGKVRSKKSIVSEWTVGLDWSVNTN